MYKGSSPRANFGISSTVVETSQSESQFVNEKFTIISPSGGCDWVRVVFWGGGEGRGGEGGKRRRKRQFFLSIRCQGQRSQHITPRYMWEIQDFRSKILFLSSSSLISLTSDIWPLDDANSLPKIWNKDGRRKRERRRKDVGLSFFCRTMTTFSLLPEQKQKKKFFSPPQRWRNRVNSFASHPLYLFFLLFPPSDSIYGVRNFFFGPLNFTSHFSHFFVSFFLLKGWGKKNWSKKKKMLLSN